MNQKLKHPAKLLYTCNANWLYATKMPMTDPALWYQGPDGRTHILASTRDIAEAREKAQVDDIHPWPEMATLKTFTGSLPARQIQWLLQELGEKPAEIVTPSDFPAVLYQELKEQNLPITTSWQPFFPERAIKTAEEIEHLREAQRVNELGFHRVEAILKEATISEDKTLHWQGEVLTSEILRAEMCKTQLDAGCTGFNDGPIVACGPHSAAPHERGHGVLKAHTFILVDSFPTAKNGYVGDLTRTYLKGEADDWHTSVYNAVLFAQENCLNALKAGVDGAELHQKVMADLKKAGFPAGTDADGTPYGMFHGTGHGVGLDVHDYPQSGTIGGRQHIFEAGHVTSVEPGLYYAGKAGCRIEDVVAITEDGIDNLTTLPKNNWVIK